MHKELSRAFLAELLFAAGTARYLDNNLELEKNLLDIRALFIRVWPELWQDFLDHQAYLERIETEQSDLPFEHGKGIDTTN